MPKSIMSKLWSIIDSSLLGVSTLAFHVFKQIAGNN